MILFCFFAAVCTYLVIVIVQGFITGIGCLLKQSMVIYSFCSMQLEGKKYKLPLINLMYFLSEGIFDENNAQRRLIKLFHIEKV